MILPVIDSLTVASLMIIGIWLEGVGGKHSNHRDYYNEMRTHVSLGKDAPCTHPIERFGDVDAHPILGGLHHRYEPNRSSSASCRSSSVSDVSGPA